MDRTAADVEERKAPVLLSSVESLYATIPQPLQIVNAGRNQKAKASRTCISPHTYWMHIKQHALALERIAAGLRSGRNSDNIPARQTPSARVNTISFRQTFPCQRPRFRPAISLHTQRAAMTEPVVLLDSVDKTFGDGTANRVHALKNINLSIGRNEFISLIGPSGCGKSTLLRVIGDLITPTAGRAQVNGKNARQARLDRDYGMVFQAATLYDWRTVAKNVQLPLELMKYPKEKKEQRTKEMLALVELSDFAGHFPWQLSGGMQQRVAIARALAFEPSILLMDEPFGALDEMTRERLNLELLDIWRKTNTTVVFITHSITEAVFLSTRVIVMSARPGRITQDIPIDLPQPRTVETRENVRFFELETQVREALRESERRPEPIEGRQPK